MRSQRPRTRMETIIEEEEDDNGSVQNWYIRMQREIADLMEYTFPCFFLGSVPLCESLLTSM